MNVGGLRCRACGNEQPEVVLSLGRMPLANSLLQFEQLDQPERVYPLELAFCPDCALVQITETVPPEQLFREYLYFSSFSDTMLSHAASLAKQIVDSRKLNDKSLVVEIASNDGYLLQYYKSLGISVLGIEPAENVARVAQETRGINTLCEFFNCDLALKLGKNGIKADVVHAHNVLAHVADLNSFVRGLRFVLKADGVCVVEVPYLKELVEHCEFDTIYHEHLCYFSLTALDRLFKRHELIVSDVECIPIHGGSLRLWIKHSAGACQNERVRGLLSEEASWGVERKEFYYEFARRISKLKASLRKLLVELKKEGHNLAAYGASAKGSTLLNYCGIGKEILDFVVDRSTYKQGRHLPGVHLPILAPEILQTVRPDYVLLLTWNFKDEILSQQQAYRNAGGRFIVPVPEPIVI